MYNQIASKLENKNIPRDERFKIITDSSNSLCQTGIFNDSITVECSFELTKDGRLIFFPENLTEDYNYKLVLPFGLFDNEAYDAKLFFSVVFPTLFVLGGGLLCCMWIDEKDKRREHEARRMKSTVEFQNIIEEDIKETNNIYYQKMKSFLICHEKNNPKVMFQNHLI